MNTENHKLSQTEMLLRHLILNRSVSTMYCSNKLLIPSHRARIKDLRDRRWPIETDYSPYIDQHGIKRRVGVYHLKYEQLTGAQLFREVSSIGLRVTILPKKTYQ